MLLYGLLHLIVLLASCAVGTPASHSKRAAKVPQFVLDYAPKVWLYSTDAYRPSDIGAQLANTHPTVNGTAITTGPSPLTLDNLDQLDDDTTDPTEIYLTSDDDFTKSPKWIRGVAPDAKGKTNGAVSCAVIVHNKPKGVTDAFYMYFYAYNQGNTVFGHQLGDHVGDWEHNMIRFIHGAPRYAWYSEHSNGEAFVWNVLEKDGKRMIAYSANGTHAVWATQGTHDHTIPDVSSPAGLIIDSTNKGILWDPLASAYFFTVSYPTNDDNDTSPTFAPLANPYDNSTPPVNWLYFEGQWGDAQLPDDDPRQAEFFGFYKYTGGPNGPRFKGLNRVDVCPDNGVPCIVRWALTDGTR